MSVGGAYTCVDSPGWRTRTSTPGASSATSSANSFGAAARSPSWRSAREASVPQWIGMAMRGSSSSTARAARGGSRCPARQVGSPPGDGDERDVDRAGQVAHLLEQVGVAREVDARRPADHEPERGHARARAASAVRRGAPGSPRSRRRRSRSALRHRPRARRRSRRSRPASRSRAAPPPGMCRPAGRSEGRWRWSWCACDTRTASSRSSAAAAGRVDHAPDVHQPVGEHGVGEEPPPADLEQRRRVAYVGDDVVTEPSPSPP